MKTYQGDRTIDGILVTVDGELLDERHDIHSFTQNGFEWTFEGQESRQLALAMLAEHLGDSDRALALTEAFMSAVVANFDNTWEMTSHDIDEVIAALE